MPQEPLRTVTGTSDTSARKVLVVYTQHPAAMLRKSVALQAWPYSGAGVVNVGDTFTVGSITYTYVSALTAPYQILRSVSGQENVKHLVTAINGTGVALGYHSSGTDKHPEVRAYYVVIGSVQAMLIVSETAGTEYAYSYTAGLATVFTPLDGGAWINRDAAQYQYDNYYKNLGLAKDEWDGVERYGLPILAELFFGDKHPMEVVHVGLNEGVVTPHEVSPDDPYGKYVSVKCKFPANVLVNPQNAEGWDKWGGGMFGNPDDGYPLVNDLVKALASSGYLAAQLDAEGIYDRNISGRFDFIILATPQAYAYEAHLTDERDRAAQALFDDSITIGEREYEGASWQCGGWDETGVHLHEYMHFAYKPLGSAYPMSDTLYGEALRDWVGSRVALSGSHWYYMLDRIPLPIPDTYIERSDYGGCDEPWNYLPCQDNHNYRSSLRTGVLHPLMAASFGLTDLSRVITESGRYEIKNMTDAYDVLCIQSPKDPRQVMMLNVYSPREINGKTDYYGAGEIYRGVYATIFRRSTAAGAFGYDNTHMIYSNFDASPSRVVTNYMTDTMIEYYGYGDIGTQESRYRYNALDVPLPNAKAVLIANPVSVFCGLHQECEGFGVKVEFVEWGEVDGVVAAVVDVTFLEEPVIPETPIPVHSEDDLTDISAKITWSEVPGEVYTLQVDTADTFEYIGVGTTCREWNTLTGSSFTIPDLLPNTLYYVRMRCHNGTEFSAWSDPISFTTIEYFWHIDNDANGALVGEVEVPSGIKKIDVTLTWDGHDPISYTHNCSPGAVQTIVIPAIYPGERVVVTYSHLLGTSTGYVDVPEISVKEVSVSQQVKLGGNEVVTIESADGLAMCYLCHYNGGVYALVVKDGVGVIYDNLTEPNGFDPLTTESAYKPFLCPDGTPFGAHISISRVLPTTSQPAVICKVCLRRT